MRVTVECHGASITIERLGETIGAEIWMDYLRLADHGGEDRRVVEHHDANRCGEAAKR
jgi:hypothetical protein